VHALALLFVEMLSDRQPFGASDSMPILAEILASERPTPSRRGLDVGPWEGILERALSLNPVTRQASAGALLDELTAAVDAAEQHWQFRSLSSANVTAPLLRSDLPRVSHEPAAATTAPEPGSTTAASASARSVGPVRSNKRTLLLSLALVAGALLAALVVLLRRPDEPMPSSREPVGSVTTPRSSALPEPSESSLTSAPVPLPAASATTAPAASASAARPHPVAPPPPTAAPAASRSRPERLAPTEKFE